MNQSKQSKQAASKSEYGTLTAKMDANNDYSSNTSGTSASSNTSATSANMSELSKLAKQSQTSSSTSAANAKNQNANQTLTEKYDITSN